MFEVCMEAMIPYIDIHTHHVPSGGGVFVLNNRFAVDMPYHTTSLFSIGIHPWDAELADLTVPAALEEYLKHPLCFAVGECGLDKLRGPGLDLQGTVFRQQLKLAEEYKKPVIIHCVKAFDELIELAEPYMKSVPMIIHGFHKSAELAAQLVAKGFYLSLNPALLKRDSFDKASVPMERLFLETDMEQAVSIESVYEAAASKYNVDTDVLKERINLNFEGLKQKK